jgi:hypothetical protein
MVQFSWFSARPNRFVFNETWHNDSTISTTVNEFAHVDDWMNRMRLVCVFSLAEHLRKTSIRRGSTTLLSASPTMSQHGLSGSDTLRKQGRKLG